MRVRGRSGGRLSACTLTAILLAATAVLAADVTWDDKISALWIRNGQGVELRAERVGDGAVDLRLDGREMVGVGCVLALVPGASDDFAHVVVPDDGYVERLPIEGSQVAVARCGATYAKLLIEAASYDPDSASPNAAGLMLTYVLSAEAR